MPQPLSDRSSTIHSPYSLLRAAALTVCLVTGTAARAEPNAVPATRPAFEARPHLAVIGFVPDPNGDERDAWIAVALEESLTWRLRRVPELTVIPTIRLRQAELEIQEPNGPAPGWEAVARGLGATHWLSGRCAGMASGVRLELTLTAWKGAAPPRRIALPEARLDEALDEATRWALAELNVPALEADLAKRILRPPSDSLSAVEYFARATTAYHRGNVREAVRCAEEAVSDDRRYRSALGLLAQLEMAGGRKGRASAEMRLRLIADLARTDGDLLDRASAELALSMLVQAEGASEAAATRAESALGMALEQRDAYAQAAALAWLTEVCIGWQFPPDVPLAGPERAKLERENLLHAAQWQSRHIELLAQLGDTIGSLPATSKLALIYERLGDTAAALEMHQRTLQLAQHLGSRPHQATAWIYLGQCYRAEKRWAEALDALRNCEALADKSLQPSVHIAIAAIYQLSERYDEALKTLQQAYDEVRALKDLPKQLTCLREMARAQHGLGRRQEALATLQKALDVAHALESPEEPALRAELDRWLAE